MLNTAAGRALGADDRIGCAVLLQMAHCVSESPGRHRPVVLVFTVQEEFELVGARGLDVSLLGQPLPTMGFNIDSGSPNLVSNEVIGTERFRVVIEGRAAHSGYAPERRVSAALVAAHAVSELHLNGWHGRITKPEGSGMANAGVLQGGEATNVVIPSFSIWAEARSHDLAFRRRIVGVWKDTFTRAAAAVTDADGRPAKVLFSPGPVYEPYLLPVVQ